MPNFVAGAVRFQRDVYPQKQELFEKLSRGQSPEALFITCSDSRIETAMMTQTEPGELFICRNAGNIVPPHTMQTGGMTASIEFAVSALRVPHIVVCGHTECGAMKGAMALARDKDALGELPHVREWLSFSKAAVDTVDALSPNASEAEKMDLLLQRNVILQMTHLKTHPAVAGRVAAGDLSLHGWVYDIKTGAILAYDEHRDTFEPLEARYAEQIKPFMQHA